jgi:hypothetical protein
MPACCIAFMKDCYYRGNIKRTSKGRAVSRDTLDIGICEPPARDDRLTVEIGPSHWLNVARRSQTNASDAILYVTNWCAHRAPPAQGQGFPRARLVVASSPYRPVLNHVGKEGRNVAHASGARHAAGSFFSQAEGEMGC